MIAVIDNYDSFTYNLVQYFGELGAEVRVFRNDAITVDGVGCLAPDHIVISPGPGDPGGRRDFRRRDPRVGPAASAPGGVPGAPVHRRGLRRAGRAGCHG